MEGSENGGEKLSSLKERDVQFDHDEVLFHHDRTGTVL